MNGESLGPVPLDPRIDTGELCCRCHQYICSSDRRGPGRQPCVRCRLQELESGRTASTPLAPAGVQTLVEACTWVIEHGICDDLSRRRLQEACKEFAPSPATDPPPKPAPKAEPTERRRATVIRPASGVAPVRLQRRDDGEGEPSTIPFNPRKYAQVRGRESDR